MAANLGVDREQVLDESLSKLLANGDVPSQCPIFRKCLYIGDIESVPGNTTTAEVYATDQQRNPNLPCNLCHFEGNGRIKFILSSFTDGQVIAYPTSVLSVEEALRRSQINR